MSKIFNNYWREFKRCFSFKGHITNKDLVSYLLINAMVMSAIVSFVIGVYDGYTNEVSSMNLIFFSVVYFLTTAGVIVKKINASVNTKIQ